MDYSFFKLHATLTEALDIGGFKNAQIGYWTSVQLSPNETYVQIMSFEGGLALGTPLTVSVVDSCDNILKDISSNVFVGNFSDDDGYPQMVFEIINIGQDWGGRAVHLKFDNGVSAYYTRPMIISDGNTNKTIRLDYKHYETIDNIGYTNAPYTQSIRIKAEYIKPKDNSEVGEYYQISTGRNISTRLLEKTQHEYQIESLDVFTYDTLKKIFKQSIIYLDNERVTNNPLLSDGDRIGRSNLISASFDIYKDVEDTFTFDYQIYDGFNISVVDPEGAYLTATTFVTFTATFTSSITINTGTIIVYDSLGAVYETFTESDMSVSPTNVLKIDVTGSAVASPADDTYYVLMSSGLVSSIGIDFEGITDTTFWVFTLRAGDYASADYDSSDYFTN